jgi:hypothetical protein
MQPNTAVFEPREDLGMRYEEFDLAMNLMGNIGHLVMPIITRDNASGKFPRLSLAQLLQRLKTKRAPGANYGRSNREFGDDSYETSEHGLEATLDDRTLARYDDIIDAEVFEGEVIEQAILLDYEIEVAELMFNPTTFAGRTGDLTNEWDDPINATPVTDIKNKKQSIKLACGVKPNALIINDAVLDNLKLCDQIINTLKYQGYQDARAGEISKQALAVSLGLDEIIVAESVYNTAGPGGDASLADIWSDEYALLARVAKTNNPMERCIGRTFMWAQEGATNGERMGVIGERYYEDARRGGVLRKRTDWGLELMQVECGYLFSNVTTH